MSDSDPPEVGEHVEPQARTEGALLFDPSSAVQLDDEAFDAPPPSAISRPVLIGFAVAAVLAVGLFGYQTLGSPSETGPQVGLPIVLPTVSGAGVRSDTIVSLPTDSVEGPVNSVVRVGVRATGQAGVAMADTVVLFRVDSGEGRIVTEEVRTNSDGIAATAVRLPSRPGETIILAEVPGSEIAPAQIFTTALPGRPEQVEISAGNAQSAEIGQLLPTRLFVLVTDADGNPVPNTQVRFRVASGEGITAPSQMRTDSTGQASALWRLGMVEGEQRLAASATGVDGEVGFTATGTPSTVRRGQETGPVETGPVTVARVPYVVGGSHVCSLSGGALRCRGGNDRGEIGAEGVLGFVSITASSSHTCALNASGIASCWGGNQRGQLGDGTRTDRSSPSRVRTELRFSHLAAGATHTCGLAGGGVPLCWGANLSGQLGDGTRNDQILPRTVGGGVSFQRLAAGWNHTCGLSSNGNAFCWGLNSNGQIGDGSRLDRLLPTLVRGAVQALVAGSSHTCGISQGRALCWGGNSFGQLGDRTTEDRTQPVAVTGLPSTPTAVAAGAVHTCALVSGGRAFCWGQNVQGQLGDGTTQNRATAVAVAGGLSFTGIYAGGALTCATTAGGEEYCWGLNQSGQLGDGTRVSRSTPTRVAG